MLRLAELAKKTRTVSFEYMGEVATVEYSLSVVTPSFLYELRTKGDLESILYQVEQTVVQWDVIGEDGDVVAPTVENLMKHQVPVQFLTEVLEQISRDMTAAREEKKA